MKKKPVERSTQVLSVRVSKERIRRVDKILDSSQPEFSNRNHAINVAIQEFIDRRENGSKQ